MTKELKNPPPFTNRVYDDDAAKCDDKMSAVFGFFLNILRSV